MGVEVFSKDMSLKTLSGTDLGLNEFEGRVLLVVNTASKCGFTGQYAGLEDLHKKYTSQGLVVMGFPCDQFGHQEPGSADEISQFCQLNYGVSFHMFEKIDVNGEKAHPLFVWLKDKAPGLLGSKGIKWNFTKFLISHDRQKVLRFAPKDTPASMEKTIESFLSEIN